MDRATIVLGFLHLVWKIDQKVFDFSTAEHCVLVSTFLSLKPIAGVFCLCCNFAGFSLHLLQVDLWDSTASLFIVTELYKKCSFFVIANKLCFSKSSWNVFQPLWLTASVLNAMYLRWTKKTLLFILLAEGRVSNASPVMCYVQYIPAFASSWETWFFFYA